jgi:hypothetical protein
MIAGEETIQSLHEFHKLSNGIKPACLSTFAHPSGLAPEIVLLDKFEMLM